MKESSKLTIFNNTGGQVFKEKGKDKPPVWGLSNHLALGNMRNIRNISKKERKGNHKGYLPLCMLSLLYYYLYDNHTNFLIFHQFLPDSQVLQFWWAIYPITTGDGNISQL